METEEMYKYSAITKSGSHKKNEDRVLVHGTILDRGVIEGECENECVAMICDGVGKDKGGDLAAECTVKHFINVDIADLSPRNLIKITRDINKDIFQKQQESQLPSTMATTATGAFLYNNHYLIFHIGDSRLYMFTKEDGLILLTQDHTSFEDPMFKHAYFEESLSNEVNNTLTRYLCGTGKSALPDIKRGTLLHDSGLLFLCSDGVYKSLSQKRLAMLLEECEDPLKTQDIMIHEAEENGSMDDKSIVLIKYSL